jgi:cyclophilin family peptidyl-prolyl cis-trans isomerase
VSRRLSLALVLLALALFAAAAGCGGSEESTGGETTSPTTETTETTGTGGTGTASCADVDLPPFGEEGTESAPDEPLDPETTYRLVFETSCGTFTVTLDQASAPNATASLVSLAESGWFDGTIVHRVVPGFVIQGGDPTQSGTGSPGYATRDEVPADAAYTRGVMAMAKTLEEPPGTAGSQFFIVTGDDVGLPPDYAIVGEVTDGLAVVEEIGQRGDTATEQPSIPIVVSGVTVETA